MLKNSIKEMPQCKFCDDKTELEWFEDHTGRWRLGIKLDINNYRPHKCIVKNDNIIVNNKRNWVDFICEICKNNIKQNVKIYKSKTINICIECDNSC